MKYGLLKENRPFLKRSLLKSNLDITYSILPPVKKPTCFIIGENSLLIECTRQLIKNHYQVKGIISDDVAVQEFAQEINLPIISPHIDFAQVLAEQPFDYLFSIVNQAILPLAVIKLARKLAINYHDGPLPAYAGVHSTFWAIVNREKTHGITWHTIEEGIDTGPILKQHLFPLAENETSISLNLKCYEAAVYCFKQLISDLSIGSIQVAPQNIENRSYFPLSKRPTQGFIINWQQPAAEIIACYRASDFGFHFNPVGLLKIYIEGTYLIVSEIALLLTTSSKLPGTILSIHDSEIRVTTLTHVIAIRALQAMDGTKLSLIEVVEKFSLTEGYCFKVLTDKQAAHVEKLDKLCARHQPYWIEKLLNFQPVLFPFFTQPSTEKSRCQQVSISGMDDVKQYINQNEQNWDAVDFLINAFLIYLSKISTNSTIGVAFQTAELDAKLEDTGDFFAHSLPLQVTLNGDLPFAQAYRICQEEIQKITSCHTYAKDLILRHPSLSAEIEKSQENTCPVIIKKVHEVTQPVVTDPYALTFVVSDQLECKLVYNALVWRKEDIEAMAHQLNTLLLHIITDAGQPLHTLSLLTRQERHQLLFEWNTTNTTYPHDKLIHQLVEQQATLSPQAIALVCDIQTLTYKELNQQANQLAHYLLKKGVGSQTMVGICLERSIEMIIGMLGILKAGGVYVPLDMNYPEERLKWMVDETKVACILTKVKWENDLSFASDLLISLDRDQDKISKESKVNSISIADAASISHILFTSGSTGKPKGVRLTNQGVVRLVKETNYITLNANTIMLGMASVAFDAFTFEIWGSLTNGGKLVLVSSRHPSLTELETIICKEQINTLLFTTALFHLFVEQGMEQLTTLQYLLTGGEVLSLAHAKKAIRQLPHCKIINAYGPTENTTIASFFPLTSLLPDHCSVPIGRPISNTQLYVLDKYRQPVPIGIRGELYIGGDGLASGYSNRADLTEEKFIPNPFKSQSGLFLYKTGDQVKYMPDGNIEFIGRFDNQVKIRGFRIEPGEIEAAISQHEQVSKAVVVVIEIIPGEKKLAAYIMSRPGISLNIQALREYVNEQLPSYMVPSFFTEVDHFPLTPNGKIDKKLLPSPVDYIKQESEEIFYNSTQSKLAVLWRGLLWVPYITVEDNFFESGGNSLLAMQLASRIESEFGIQLSIKDIFEQATIRQLSAHIENIRQNFVTKKALLAPFNKTDQPIPLSSGQQRLWFINHLPHTKSTYHVPVIFTFSGNLNVEVLEQSIEEIIKRHHILRTTFNKGEGQPFQYVKEVNKVHIPILVMEEEDVLIAQPKALQKFESDIDQAFDLEQDQLFRIKVAMLEEDKYLLFIVFHHIITDGWSIQLFNKELNAIYPAFLQNQPSPLPKLPLQYADYTLWHLQRLQHTSLETGLVYWKQKLADLPELLPFPTDKPRPVVQTFEGAAISFTIPADLTRKIKKVGKQSDSTLFITLLAIFKVLLHKYTQTSDIVVGTPVANRPHQDLESLIGFFVNTIVLRTDVSGDITFHEFLQQLHHTALQAYAHQEVPFEQIVEGLNPRRSTAYHPLIQVMFDLENNFISDKNALPFSLESLVLTQKTAKFDLHLSFAESKAGLQGTLMYSRDILTKATAERIASHYTNLVQAIVSKPDEKIAAISMLSVRERNQILYEWNHTQVQYEVDHLIDHLFEAQVLKTPDAIALSYEGQSLTYAQLNVKANQLAHYLQTVGVGPDILVGVCMERSLEMVISIYGILKAGGAYVPFDPQYPGSRLAYMIEDTKVPVVLTTQPWKNICSGEGIQVLLMDTDQPILQAMPTYNPKSGVQPDNLAYVIYTSGSTGQPKGVMNIHSALVNRILWMQQTYQLTPADKVLQKTPFSFDVSVWEFFWPLISGAALVMAKPGGHKDPMYLKDLIIEEKITTLHFVPSMLGHFVEVSGIKDCTSLRNVFCSGEALPVALQNRFLDLLPVDLHNLYGPTEAAIDVTYWPCCKDNSFTSVPIGRPIANTQIYILDAQKEPVPVGVSGEIYIGGANLARGYLNKKGLTAEKFIWHSFAGGQLIRLYQTGDIGRFLNEGIIEYIGRRDNQIKIRGFRIELGEIESVIAQFEAVKEVAVMAQQSPRQDKQLVGYVTAAQGKTLNVSDLKQFLIGKLPDFMVPGAWVIMEEMPLTPSGKVNRKALPIPALLVSSPINQVAPQTSTEKQLALIWEKVLKVEKVGIHDNFFELGGHSLLTIPIMAEIQSQTGCQFPVSTIFAKPTIYELALAIDQANSHNPWHSLVPIQPNGSKPPLYFIHAISGEVDYVYKLAPYFPSDQPIFGLQAVGMNGTDTPQESIEQMAAYYLELILSQQKEGTYHVGGYSLGGMIAYEMARQLKAMGKEVGMVALFDTYTHKPGQFTYLHMPMYAVLYSCWNFLIDPTISITTKRRAISKEVPLFVKHLYYKFKKSKTSSHKNRIQHAAKKAISTYDKLTQAGFKAYHSYTIKPYSGKVIFFHATENSAKYVRNHDFGWKKYAKQGVDMYHLTSDHDSIFKFSSTIKFIAQTFDKYLYR